MSNTKSSDFVKYKFKALKTYASTEWLAESKKKYRQVFDKNELTYIYAELSFFNKLFDEEDWDAEITLKAFAQPKDRRKKGVEMCNINVNKAVSKDQNIVYVREGWGMEKQAMFWKEGSYYWEAYIHGQKLGSRPFYVYDAGTVNAGQNPYLEIEGVKLYEGSNQDSRKSNPQYLKEFNSDETRFVWIEFKAKNKIKGAWMAELIFNFYNDARQLKGRTIELIPIKENQGNMVITSGWGSDHKGTWFADNYTVEIVFMDTLIGIVPFKVDKTNIEGESQLLLPDETGQAILGNPSLAEVDEMTLEEVLKELDDLIGLEQVKGRIREYAQYLSFLQLRKEKGFEDPGGVNLHVVFTGNPGTGKTTVARMLGRIYKKLGLLNKGHVHEVDRSDIIGEYIGQTAPKVKDAIEKARGGILFIDEAYALARGGDDTKDYGREVIELLIKEMTSGKDDLAIVVAGYPKEMETFLNSNPGLKSRFNMRFEFEDYTPQELEKIAHSAAEKAFVTLSEAALDALNKKLTEAYRGRDSSFGNARYAISLIKEAKMNLGLRIMKLEDREKLTKEDLSIIQEEDILNIFETKSQKMARIPVDEALLAEALDDLNRMIGLENVKKEVQELVKLVRFYKEMGKDVLNRFSLHSVFTGNPGTGKTTVARILGKIYKALGILERGNLVECDRQHLVAGHVGQTAIKTAAVIEKARGGVLFIDEAYALSSGAANDFGNEAIETLLKRMEDMRGELVVIAVGYPDNMKKFLDANPGLRSRFDRKFEFQDYTPEQLMDIAKLSLLQDYIVLEPEAASSLEKYFQHLYAGKNKFFGNARAVRKVVEEAIKNQHLRLAQLPSDQREDHMLHVLTEEDVRDFAPGNDKLLEGGGSRRVGF